VVPQAISPRGIGKEITLPRQSAAVI